MTILPKEIYRCNANPYLKKKKAHGIFHRIRANNPKISHKRPPNCQNNLKEKKKKKTDSPIAFCIKIYR